MTFSNKSAMLLVSSNIGITRWRFRYFRDLKAYSHDCFLQPDFQASQQQDTHFSCAGYSKSSINILLVKGSRFSLRMQKISITSVTRSDASTL